MIQAALHVATVSAGLLLLFAVLQDAYEVMLLPRRVRRRFRLMGVYFRQAWRAWTALARRWPEGPGREGVLSQFGALSMLTLFALWAAGLILGFGTLEWSFQDRAAGHTVSSFWEQIYMSGVTFFTLGYGDVVPHTGLARGVAVLEAGAGIGFIAVVIGYLPVLYQLFSRREAHVIQLDGRAGSPPTAGTMLARHAAVGGLDRLEVFLREWEVWGSDLLESHLSYPMLAYYRSQHDNQSWLAGVGCLMDVCALVLVGIPGLQPLQARMTFTMARQVLVEMARSFRVEPSRFDGGDRLDHDAYLRLEAALVDAGVGWEVGEQSERTLAALRATYEPLLDGLAKHLMLSIPGWLPNDLDADHWQRGHRGMIASRLVEDLATRAEAADGSVTWRSFRRKSRSDVP